MFRKELLKKIAAVSLVGCMSLGLFAGCGTDSSQKTDAPKDDTEVVSKTDENEEEGDEIAGAVGTKLKVEDGYGGYLGYGYDVINEPYFNEESVSMDAEVLDMDKVLEAGLIYTAKMRSSDSAIHVYDSEKMFYGAMAAGGFLAGFGVDYAFAGEAGFYKDIFVADFKQFVWSWNEVRTDREYIRKATAKNMAAYVTDDFKSDANSMSAEEILQKYGSFVMTDVQLGGAFDVFKFTDAKAFSAEEIEAVWAFLYAENVKVADDVEVGETTNASGEKVDVVAEAGAWVETYFEKYDYYKNLSIYTLGGNVKIDRKSLSQAMKDLSAWEESVLDGETAFVDCTGAIPVWELVAQVATPEKGEEVEAAFWAMFEEVFAEYE